VRSSAVNFSGVVIRNADLIDVDMTGDVENLRINEVDVGPFIEADWRDEKERAFEQTRQYVRCG
jgi:hypothetical protein